MNSELTLESFGARQGGKALSDPLTLRLSSGTVLGVVGPNGVGKSSLLGAIAGTGISHYGALTFGEVSLDRIRARQRSALVAFLPQDLHAPDELCVRELVEVGAHAGGRTNIREAALTALAELDVQDLVERRIGTLSGGQRQLVQFARVLAQNTPIIVLDEPSSALDLYHQRVIAQTMRRLGNDGKIIIAALHDLNLALGTCSEILLLDHQGRSHTGTPEHVLTPDLVHAAYGVHTKIHTTENGRSFIAPLDHGEQ